MFPGVGIDYVGTQLECISCVVETLSQEQMSYACDRDAGVPKHFDWMSSDLVLYHWLIRFSQRVA
jgi:hypothetical protein